MKRNGKNIILTLNEAEDVAALLYTLEATGGVFDEEYTKEAKKAGKYASKLMECLDNE